MVGFYPGNRTVLAKLLSHVHFSGSTGWVETHQKVWPKIYKYSLPVVITCKLQTLPIYCKQVVVRMQLCECACFALKIIVATLGEYSLTSAEPARLKATDLLVYVWRETLFV